MNTLRVNASSLNLTIQCFARTMFNKARRRAASEDWEGGRAQGRGSDGSVHLEHGAGRGPLLKALSWEVGCWHPGWRGQGSVRRLLLSKALEGSKSGPRRGAGLEAGDQGAGLVGLTTVISGQGLRLTDQR